jgi:hypothetical protein
MRIWPPESRVPMSSDQLAASVEGSAAAVVPRAVAWDEVVVPLRAPGTQTVNPVVGARAAVRPRRPKAGAAAAGAAQVVTQFTDYIKRGRRLPVLEAGLLPSRPVTAPSAVSGSVALHADELDGLLHQHIESHLQRIAAHAPDLVQPVDNVRRSVELLLKLRRR